MQFIELFAIQWEGSIPEQLYEHVNFPNKDPKF